MTKNKIMKCCEQECKEHGCAFPDCVDVEALLVENKSLEQELTTAKQEIESLKNSVKIAGKCINDWNLKFNNLGKYSNDHYTENSELCACCGHHYHSIYSVPNDVWKLIAPCELGGDPSYPLGGLLCPECAWVRAKKLGIVLRFSGSNGDWLENKYKASLPKVRADAVLSMLEGPSLVERGDTYDMLIRRHAKKILEAGNE